MASCKPYDTPVDTKQKLTIFVGTSYDDPTLYWSLAGALQYLTFIRLDISYAIKQVCFHMHALCTEHMLALKRSRVTFKAPYKMVCISILLLSRSLFPTQMLIGVDVPTLVDLLRVIVFFLVTT